MDERIDHIFLSEAFSVDRYAILTEGDVDKTEQETDKNIMHYPSDHFPVMASVQLK